MPDESGSVRPVVVFAVVAAAGGPAVSAVSVAAAEASRDARLCARRERRRGSGPEARAPSPEGTALVSPVFPATPLARVAPTGEAGLG